jgi:hypothetical protein
MKVQEMNTILRQNYLGIPLMDTEVMTRHTEDLVNSVESRISESDTGFLLRTIFVGRDTKQAGD